MVAFRPHQHLRQALNILSCLSQIYGMEMDLYDECCRASRVDDEGLDMQLSTATAMTVKDMMVPSTHKQSDVTLLK